MLVARSLSICRASQRAARSPRQRRLVSRLRARLIPLGCLADSDRADIEKALLRDIHAFRGMMWLGAVHIQRKHGISAVLLSPADHPTERRPAQFSAKQPALGANDGIADLGHRQYIAHDVLAAF